MSSPLTLHPEILWAQRSSETDPERNIIMLTIHAPDLQPGFEFTTPSSKKLHFKGTSKPATDDLRHYACDIDLFGEIKDEDVKPHVIGKGLFVTLQKKELQEEYWPRLSREKRVNNIKTDFDKWVDQDEQDGTAAAAAVGGVGDMDFGSMGGMGGMPGMPGMGGMGGDMDFEKLMAQMGNGGSGLGGDAADDADDDADDDDADGDAMPSLEPATDPQS